MTLQELIETLEMAPFDALIEFDFGGRPGEFISWRGDYSELSITADGPANRTVGEFLFLCDDAVGTPFTGYKGGEFTMGRETRVWADVYGSASGRRPAGIRKQRNGIVIIATEFADF